MANSTCLASISTSTEVLAGSYWPELSSLKAESNSTISSTGDRVPKHEPNVDEVKKLWPISYSPGLSSVKSRKRSPKKKAFTTDNVPKDQPSIDQLFRVMQMKEKNIECFNGNFLNHSKTSMQQESKDATAQDNEEPSNWLSEFGNQLVLAMLDDKAWCIALSYLHMANSLPSVKIFEILLNAIAQEQCNVTIAVMIYQYLLKVLHMFPPKGVFMRKYYYIALFMKDLNNRNDRRMFEIIQKRIKCCIKGSCSGEDLSTEESCGGNCLLYLQFIIEVLLKDHNYITSQRKVQEGKTRPSSLILRTFWPVGIPHDLSVNCRQLIHLLNKMFKHCSIAEMNDTGLLDIFQQLLSMIAESVLFYVGIHKVEAIYYPGYKTLTELRREISCNCKYVFRDAQNLLLFLQGLHPKWFRIIIYDSVSSHFIHKRWIIPQTLSLRGIVFSHIYKKHEKVEADKADGTSDEDGDCPSRKKLKLNPPSNPDSLPEEKSKLVSSEIESAAQPPVYDGETRLHIAVKQNNVELVRLLLELEGTALCNVKSSLGQTPLKLIQSDEMRSVFDEFNVKSSADNTLTFPLLSDCIQSSNNNALLSNFTSGTGASPICTKYPEDKEKHIYCYQHLIRDYINFFHLNDPSLDNPPSDSLRNVVMKHFVDKLQYNANDDVLTRFFDDLYTKRNFEI